MNLCKQWAGPAVLASLIAIAGPLAAEDVEPNERWQHAQPVEALAPIAGRVDRANDRDYFRFEIDSTIAAGGFAVETEAFDGTLTEVCLTDAEGRNLQCRRGAPRLVLPSLGPAPGVYGVLVRGAPEGASYRVEFPPAFLEADQEREPNDRPELAAAMESDSDVVRGAFDSKEDDHYGFEVEGPPRLWRIQANADARITIGLLTAGGQRVTSQTGDRQVRLDRLLLLPGRHLINATGEDSEYDLRVIDLGPPPQGAEAEPNDQPGTENQIARDRQGSGAIDTRGDKDGWIFSVHAPERLGLRLTPPADAELRFDLVWEGRSLFRSAYSSAPIEHEALLQPGEYRLVVDGRNASLAEYRILLETLPWSEIDAAPDQAGLGIAIDAPKRAPAAFVDEGQRVSLATVITNESNEPIQARFETRASHHAWRVNALAPVTVPPGSASTLELDVEVPPDAWAGHPVRVALIARAAGGEALAEAEQIIVPDPDATPVNPFRAPAVPEALRGGLNLASAALGAQWVPVEGIGRAPSDRYIPWLNDGMITLRDSFQVRFEPGATYPPTYRLPVEAPAELAGVVIHPQGAHPLAMQPKRVEILVSTDGATFESVLEAELSAAPVEQAIAFERPVAARFVRLNLLEAHGGDAVPVREIRLGEFSAIAVPGSRPFGDRRFDLAKPELGGHVVWADPVVHMNSWDAVMLSAADERPFVARIGMNNGEVNTWRAEWVIGFQHDRAARIDGATWRDSAGGRTELGFQRFELAVSTSSPIGPWTRLGAFELPPFDSEQGRTANYEFPATWARYVRVRATAEQPGDARAARAAIAFPDQISVFEQAVDVTYRSILGLWGHGRRDAILEQLHPATDVEPALRGNAADSAWPLAVATEVSGFVQLDRYEHWYAVDVAEGDNVLNLDLAGTGNEEVGVELFDSEGTPLELRPAPMVADDVATAQQRLVADVSPGRYLIRLHEPPWSLMFIWDNSGSMSSYLPIVYDAVAAYAHDIRPNQFANLMPFRHGAPLLDQFTDQPLALLKALNDYPRKDASSAAEGTLRDATNELAERDGLKGIVMITDAATGREPEVWRALAEVRPRVFTVQVGSTGTLGLIGGSGTLAQDLMQSWANVNDGFHAYPRNVTELSVAYARASAMMRRPKAYRLRAASEAIEPGELVVEGGVAGAAVEIVFDASGSMLQRLDGERRIAIARDVVAELVTETLDERSRFALRAFGHRNPDECFTERLLPLSPLDADAVIAAIRGIEAKNLARTPIGDALRSVADDLREVDGERLVVLVTDGEETCDGDPGAEIAGLVASHPATRVHIVGFAIDDTALIRQFRRWADTGRGDYFPANSRAELGQALAEALSPRFVVVDANDQPVAEGVSGQGPISLPPGRYAIEVASQPPRRLESIEVRAAERTRVAIDG